MISSQRLINRNGVQVSLIGRYLSDGRFRRKPVPVIPEAEKKLMDQKIETAKKIFSHSTLPRSLTDAVPAGKELHIPNNISEVAVFSGMPAEQAERVVVIAPRAVKTLQSGGRTDTGYTITWKNQERWSNPLMGWTSSADPMANVKLTFDTLELAQAYASKNGWKYEVRSPVINEHNKYRAPSRYAENFLPRRTKSLMVDMGKNGKDIFKNKDWGGSHWFQPLKFHGDGKVRQHGLSDAQNCKL